MRFFRRKRAAEPQIPNIEMDLSPVVLGTAMYGSSIVEGECFRMMDTFIENGGNFFDSAHIYADWISQDRGASEKTIGRWLRKTGLRKKLFVTTKGGHPGLKPMAGHHMSHHTLKQHLFESMERLGTDYIDLYWLHTDEKSIPVGEMLDVLDEFQRNKWIRGIGLSNWSLPRLREAIAYTQHRNSSPVIASQVGWSLAKLHRTPDVDPLQTYMNNDMYQFHLETRLPVVAYSSQAGGFFAKESLRRQGQADASHNESPRGQYYTGDNLSRYEAATRVAMMFNCDANSIALSYLWSQPFPTFSIIGPRYVDQVRTAMKCAWLRLSGPEMAVLERAGS